MKHGKNYSDSVKAFDLTKTYEASEAVGIVLETAKAKFDETIELHVRLGVDPRQADQQVRGVLVLPHGTGKTKKVLVIGGSTGYGLASRIAVTYGYGADTISVAFEKEAKGKRTASAGWYNTKAFEKLAKEDGYYAKSFNGDGFSAEMKQQVIEAIKEDWGKVDMVVYSLAAPRRTMPDGTTVSSVLKTVGKEFTNKTIDLRNNEVKEVTVPVATEEEIENTVKVMGGEDWELWIRALAEADVLAENAVTLAYSYIGPTVTHAIYKDGSIGQAKKHLYETSKKLQEEFADKGLQAYISVNKALVTQSSAAIPIVPLYISLVYKIMKEKGLCSPR